MNELIGNFRVLAKIGEGGMGEVYRGVDTLLEREVAIKSLRADFACRPDVVERFRTEAVALAKLNHHNIVALYSFFRHDEAFFMVLEYVQGETLDRIVQRRGALPWPEAVGLACQALEGLEHAHRLGIVHRDVKPSNAILTAQGELKLMDFGIARILSKARLTRVGHLVGTLEYMAPEQVQGQDGDARGDLYALGVVLYELVTGRVPFTSDTEYGLIKAQVEQPPPPPRSLAAIPQALETVLLQALEKQPQARFQSAAEFRTALQQVMAEEEASTAAKPVAPTRVEAPGPAMSRAGGRSGALSMLSRYGVVAAAVVMVGVGVLLAGLSRQRAPAEPPAAGAGPATVAPALSAATVPTSPAAAEALPAVAPATLPAELSTVRSLPVPAAPPVAVAPPAPESLPEPVKPAVQPRAEPPVVASIERDPAAPKVLDKPRRPSVEPAPPPSPRVDVAVQGDIAEARQMMASGDFKAARGLLKSVLTRDPGNQRAQALYQDANRQISEIDRQLRCQANGSC